MYFLETSLVIEWQVWHKVSASHVNYGAFSEHVQDFIILYMDCISFVYPWDLPLKSKDWNLFMFPHMYSVSRLFYNNTILRMSTITMFEYWGEVSLGGLALTSAKVIHISLFLTKLFLFWKKIIIWLISKLQFWVRQENILLMYSWNMPEPFEKLFSMFLFASRMDWVNWLIANLNKT